MQLSEMTWLEADAAASAGQLMIVPTGATEAHGPHLPLDCDTQQAETFASLLADRVGAVVAPAIPYGYSMTFCNFPGTVSLSIETYQQIVFEVCIGLVNSGFRKILILNGNRPNGTSNDAVARRVVDAVRDRVEHITAVSYWEPGAAAIHEHRSSPVGGMGHACEFETSFQLATRPHLVHLDRLEGVEQPRIAWDLVAPEAPNRTYATWPDPADGHPAIFGSPAFASADSGRVFMDLALDALVDMVGHLAPSYEGRPVDIVTDDSASEGRPAG
jgi:creatinine amidohydrolase